MGTPFKIRITRPRRFVKLIDDFKRPGEIIKIDPLRPEVADQSRA